MIKDRLQLVEQFREGGNGKQIKFMKLKYANLVFLLLLLVNLLNCERVHAQKSKLLIGVWELDGKNIKGLDGEKREYKPSEGRRMFWFIDSLRYEEYIWGLLAKGTYTFYNDTLTLNPSYNENEEGPPYMQTKMFIKNLNRNKFVWAWPESGTGVAGEFLFYRTKNGFKKE